MNLQNCSYIALMRGMDMHVLSIYTVCLFIRLFVHLFVWYTKRRWKSHSHWPKPIKGVRELDWVVGEWLETSPIPQKQCMCTEELFRGPLTKMWRKKPLSSSKSNHCWHDYLNSIRFYPPEIRCEFRSSLKNIIFSKPGMLRVHDSFAVAFYLTFEVKCPPCEPHISTLPATNSSHLKMDGWKTFSFPFVSVTAYFQGKIVSFREGTLSPTIMEVEYHPRWKETHIGGSHFPLPWLMGGRVGCFWKNLSCPIHLSNPRTCWWPSTLWGLSTCWFSWVVLLPKSLENPSGWLCKHFVQV